MEKRKDTMKVTPDDLFDLVRTIKAQRQRQRFMAAAQRIVNENLNTARRQRQNFIAAAQSIGQFDSVLEGHPIWDREGNLIGVAEAMPQNDEEFDALVASAEILD